MNAYTYLAIAICAEVIATASMKAVKGFSTPLPLLRSFRPDASPDLEAVVAKACALDPADRYPSVAEFGEDLRRFLAGDPVRARRPGAVMAPPWPGVLMPRPAGLRAGA